MSEAGTFARAVLAVVHRDLRVFLSYRTRFVSQMLNALFSVTLFYYVSRLVTVSGFGSPDAYFAFVVVGIALIGVLYSCFSIGEMVRQELVAGTFERLLLSRFGPVRSVISMTVFPLMYSFVLASVTLILAWALFGLDLHWSTVPFAIPGMALALLAFLPFGIFFSALTVVIKQGSVGTSWVIALISIVGGLYFPIALLPDWAQTATELQPFTPATEMLRHLLVDTPQRTPLGEAIAKLIGFTAILLPLSIFALRAAIRTGQRRGTIIEY